MKKSLWMIFLAMIVCFSVTLLANDAGSGEGSSNSLMDSVASASLDKDEAASDDSATVVEGDKNAKDEKNTKKDKAEDKKDKKEEENKGLATLPNGKAYVGVYSYLHLRDGVWGGIQAHLYNNEEVTITGRDGDWYKVDTGKGSGYAHARYIFDSKDKRYRGNEVTGASNGPSAGGRSRDVVINVSGDSLQGKIVSAAKALVDKYPTKQSFPYAPGTQNGNLGCAQVATTALKAAGALSRTSLGCSETIDLLAAKGWTSVSWPPYQAGDVIFWETYRPGPSHVGIIMSSGNSVQAMNNSSRERRPRYSDADSMKVCKVMRKC